MDPISFVESFIVSHPVMILVIGAVFIVGILKLPRGRMYEFFNLE